MSDVRVFYREIAASPEIAHLVWSFWEFVLEGENAGSFVHEVFPDGCVSLFCYRNKIDHANSLLISALSLESSKIRVSAGDAYWGMRFSPAACAKILRFSPSQLQSQNLNESKDFLHLTAGLIEKISICRNFDKAVEIYEAQIKSLALNVAEIDEKVAATVEFIEENRGEAKISGAAKTVGLSARQLERRFRKNTGLTPKQFARARRIRATAINLVEKNNMNWANRAAEMGFTDQAHLTHEISTVTGSSPNRFAEGIKKIEHGELIK